MAAAWWWSASCSIGSPLQAASGQEAWAFARGSVSDQRDSSECNRRLAALPKGNDDNCPLRHSPAGCYIVHIRRSSESRRRSREGGNLASLSHPQPPHAPGRSVRQRTSTRQLTVADMPENEYDDSNAAAKDPVPSPDVCNPLTHATKVPTSVARPTPTRSDPGRSQGTPPEPVPVPTTQSRRWRHRPWFLPQPPLFPRRREPRSPSPSLREE